MAPARSSKRGARPVVRFEAGPAPNPVALARWHREKTSPAPTTASETRHRSASVTASSHVLPPAETAEAAVSGASEGEAPDSVPSSRRAALAQLAEGQVPNKHATEENPATGCCDKLRAVGEELREVAPMPAGDPPPAAPPSACEPPAAPAPPACTPLGGESRVRVGEGTYGTVYRAWREDGSAIAIKVCKQLGRSSGVPLAAYRELLAHRRLRTRCSPCLAQQLGAWMAGGKVEIGLAYVDTTLEAALADRPAELTALAVARVTGAVAEALGCMHREWFVHRDVSPNNILLSADLRAAQLADFGMARPFLNPPAPLSRDGEVVKLAYRAPELLAAAAPQHGPPIDQWALGCVVVEMATRAPAFAAPREPGGGAPSLAAQLRAIGEAVGRPPPGWPSLTQTAHDAEWVRDALAGLPPAPAVSACPLAERLAHAPVRGASVTELATSLLRYEPERRWTAAEVADCSFVRGEQHAEAAKRASPDEGRASAAAKHRRVSVT